MVTTATAAAISRKGITRRRIIRLTRINMAIIMGRLITRTVITDIRHTRINQATIKANRLIRTAIIRDSRRTLTRTANIRGNLRIRISRRFIRRRQDITIITVTATIRKNGNTAVPRTRFVEW
jgi:hypothetical protein